MDRKSAIAAAGTVALTLTATGVAIAANMGLLNQKTSSDLGQLSASVSPPSAEISTGARPDPEVVTIYQDVAVPARNAGAGELPVAGSLTEDTRTGFSAAIPADSSPLADDHGDDGFEVENEDHEDEDHADEDHRTEDHSEEDHESGSESESEDDD